jgi:hypothetical protein
MPSLPLEGRDKGWGPRDGGRATLGPSSRLPTRCPYSAAAAGAGFSFSMRMISPADIG